MDTRSRWDQFSEDSGKESFPRSDSDSEDMMNPAQSGPSKTDRRKALFLCDLCEVECCSIDALQKHFAGIKHQKKLGLNGLSSNLKAKYDIRESDELSGKIVACTLCKVVFHGLERAIHFKSEKHRALSNFANESVKKIEHSQFLEIIADAPADCMEGEVDIDAPEEVKDGYRCTLCDATLTTRTLFQAHVEGKKHQKKARWHYLCKEGESVEVNQYWCRLCNTFCTDRDALTTHYRGKNHIKILQKKGWIRGDEEVDSKPTDSRGKVRVKEEPRSDSDSDESEYKVDLSKVKVEAGYKFHHSSERSKKRSYRKEITSSESDYLRSPSPPARKKKNRSRSPFARKRRNSSRSPPRKRKSRSPSPSPRTRKRKDRSPSPLVFHKRKGHSPSPPVSRKRKDRSPSPRARKRKDRSPSPVPYKKKGRSPSPVPYKKKGRSPSPVPYKKKGRSPSPKRKSQSLSSLSAYKKKGRSRSPSSSPIRRRKSSSGRKKSPPFRSKKKSYSSSPVFSSSPSPSPVRRRKSSSGRTRSPIAHKKKNLSPSPVRRRKSNKEVSRSPSDSSSRSRSDSRTRHSKQIQKSGKKRKRSSYSHEREQSRTPPPTRKRAKSNRSPSRERWRSKSPPSSRRNSSNKSKRGRSARDSSSSQSRSRFRSTDNHSDTTQDSQSTKGSRSSARGRGRGRIGHADFLFTEHDDRNVRQYSSGSRSPSPPMERPYRRRSTGSGMRWKRGGWRQERSRYFGGFKDRKLKESTSRQFVKIEPEPFSSGEERDELHFEGFSQDMSSDDSSAPPISSLSISYILHALRKSCKITKV